MDYFILFLAVLCIAINFNIYKFYQKKYADTTKDMLLFPLLSSIANLIFFILLNFILYGKLPEFSAFSFTMSIVLSVFSTLSLLVGLVIIKYGKMSVYSTFMMLGGMILPYFYGLFFLSEAISIARIIGLVILICALPCSAVNPSGEKKTVSNKFYYILCICIFFINGSISIVSKSHSINDAAISPVSFIIYANFWAIIIDSVIYYIFSLRSKNPEKPELSPKIKPNGIHMVLTISICAVVGAAGYLFQLMSAETVPAVAMFPFVTGGSIVLTTVLARIFHKEKISKFAMIGVIMSLAGTLLFLIV